MSAIARVQRSFVLIYLVLVVISCRSMHSGHGASATAQSARIAGAGIFPERGADEICPDTTLRISFSSPPLLGDNGKIQVFDAATKQVVESIDLSEKPSTMPVAPT